jgi:hypothetical protein
MRQNAICRTEANGVRSWSGCDYALELPGANPLKEAHATLDAAVLAAYGFSPKKDLLAQLLELNLEVARRIDGGESVLAPGIPPDYPQPKELVSDDCIEPRKMALFGER